VGLGGDRHSCSVNGKLGCPPFEVRRREKKNQREGRFEKIYMKAKNQTSFTVKNQTKGMSTRTTVLTLLHLRKKKGSEFTHPGRRLYRKEREVSWPPYILEAEGKIGLHSRKRG